MKNISCPYIGKIKPEMSLLHIVSYKSNVIIIKIQMKFFREI